MKDYNVLINTEFFFDQPVKVTWKHMNENITKFNSNDDNKNYLLFKRLKKLYYVFYEIL